MLVVGGGPAGMATALHLARLQRERGGDPLTVAVLEKARDNGAHCLSGAVFDPSVLRELVPNCESLDVPLGTPVQDDRVMYFTPRKAIRFPITPPPLKNHGCYVTSLNRLVKWMADLAEKDGTHVFNGFSASELLYDG
ncbi:MAG TPA: electron transfer flavoprotein-ubiquinone oxidoreductase, partial [Acidobacteria bacterium]|nr:electron transfer flavoprotein-ubiquinone oxidoreductase [Acidobacteriota bacterium]